MVPWNCRTRPGTATFTAVVSSTTMKMPTMIATSGARIARMLNGVAADAAAAGMVLAISLYPSSRPSYPLDRTDQRFLIDSRPGAGYAIPHLPDYLLLCMPFV